MRSNIYILLLLIFNINAYCQKTTNVLHEKYYNGIHFYLSPTDKDYKRELLYISIPQDGTSEYSMAIESKEDTNFLIVRKFISSYWSTVFANFQQKGLVKSRINSFEINISKEFNSRLKGYFQQVIKNDPDTNYIDRQIDDGNQYLLKYNSYEREIAEFYFSENKMYKQLIELCEDISRAIIAGTFKEDFYIKKIKQLENN